MDRDGQMERRGRRAQRAQLRARAAEERDERGVVPRRHVAQHEERGRVGAAVGWNPRRWVCVAENSLC